MNSNPSPRARFGLQKLVRILDRLVGPAIIVLIIGLWISTRSGPAPTDDVQSGVEMPVKVLDDAERDLYLTPGGKYTAADIAANGRMTASQRYRDFHARHDANPQPGDLLCPITQTKANPSCTWTIDGSRYSFCCPPCIDEFLLLAKSDPERILTPQAYKLRPEP
jgi:hypothetical protein